MKQRECSLKNFIALDRCVELIDWPLEFKNQSPIDVEIGFGMGEHLIRLATANENRNFVGIEQDRKRLLRTAKSIGLVEKKEKREISNVRLLGVDAWIVFERLFDIESIDNIYCLFPCPWPKKKHIKFRLFNQQFLKLLNSRLKFGGILQIVTDYYPFYEWILEEKEGTGLLADQNVIGPQFNTKFEKKWRECGQHEFYELCFRKISAIDYPVKKETPLEAYKLTTFDPDKFVFTNCEGEISVILKDRLYDPLKQQMMLRFVVAEPNLMQNFWVTITRKGKEWIIGRAVGQNLLQTQGLSQALKMVYDEAQRMIL